MDKAILPSEAIDEKQKRKLTKKQKAWLKFYIESGDATDAALRAYRCKNKQVASNMGSQLRKALAVDELLEESGVTDIEITLKLKEGLKATKLTKTGAEMPDYDVRHKYMTTALQLKGKLNNKVELSGEGGGPIKLNILAGHGFIPNFSKPRVVDATSESSTDGKQQEVQSPNLAQTGSQNDNGNNGTGQTSTS